MTREAQAAFQDRTREWIGGLDLISREEFEAVRAIAVAAREENEVLRARVESLEAAIATMAAKPAASGSRKKPAAGEAGA